MDVWGRSLLREDKTGTPFLTSGVHSGCIDFRIGSAATSPSAVLRCRASCRTLAKASADRFNVVLTETFGT